VKYDTTQRGLETLYPPYLAAIADNFLERGAEFEAKSLDMWKWLRSDLGIQISRASVINGLYRLVDDGLLAYREETGKGGHHRIYRAAMTRLEWNRHVYDVFVSHIKKNLPTGD